MDNVLWIPRKSENPTPRFGRVVIEDPQDNDFLLRQLALPPLSAITDPFRYYFTGPVLDQGWTSHCVGYAWIQWMMTDPVRTHPSIAPVPGWVYSQAQLIDEWEGVEPTYYGTSVRAGAKIMQRLGHLVEYRWTFDADESAAWILAGNGPLVFGTTWYSGMDTLDQNGVGRATGRVRGGHAFLCVGYSRTTGRFRFINSWGLAYGQRGRFWLLGEDVQKLLGEGGEACAAIQQKVA